MNPNASERWSIARASSRRAQRRIEKRKNLLSA
jgi:hypothetical protein